MLPLVLIIKGFGPHSETRIDFSVMRSPMAICAPYGTGKTFLLESVIACLFGQFPWYAGSLYDALTQGGTGEGELSLTFEHAGRQYIAIREVKDTGKTRTQRANLIDITDIAPPDIYAGKLIAGPKVSDFEAEIELLLGSFDLARSTWFQSQNRSGDLCGQPGEKDLTARRRAVFNELIGAGALDAACETITETLRKLAGSVEELETLLANAGDAGADHAEATQRLVSIESMIENDRMVLSAGECGLDQARAALRDASGGDDVLKGQIDLHSRAVSDLDQAKRLEQVAHVQLSELTARAAKIEQAREDVKALEGALALRTRLEDQAVAFNAHWIWGRQLAELDGRRAATERTIDALKSQPGADEATIALAATLDKITADYRNYQDINAARTRSNDERLKFISACAKELTTATANRDSLIARRNKRPETPFGAECSSCPLMIEYAGLDAEIDKAHDEILRIEKVIEDIPEPQGLIDLEPIIKRGAEARAASEAVKAAHATQARIAELEAELASINFHMADLRNSEPVDVEDPTEQLAHTRRAVDALAGANERLAACDQAATDAQAKSAELAELNDRVKAAMKRVAETQGPAESARMALASREAQRATLTSDVNAREISVAEVRRSLERSIAEASELRTRIAYCEERMDEMDEQRKRLNDQRDLLEGLKDARVALGPKGVRQILIDDAAPDLEAIADDLFERATGGRMRLRIATQSLRQDGSMQEDFQILVRDSKGERDATAHSGGELQLIQIIFRIAVALWVGRMRGAAPDCLFLDEAFDRLGADGTEDLLRVLDYLSDQFKLICVVTHDQSIANRMASNVVISRGAAGVTVEAA